MKQLNISLALSLLLSAPTTLLPLWSSEVKDFEKLAIAFKQSGNEADRQKALAEYQRIQAAAAKRPAIRAALPQALKNAGITEAQLRTAVTRAPGAGAGAAPVIAGPAAAVPTITDANIRAAVTRITAALDKLRADALATLQSGEIRMALEAQDKEMMNLYNQLTVEQRAAFAAERQAIADRWNDILAIHNIQRDIIDDIIDRFTLAQEADTVVGGENARKVLEDRITGLETAIRTRVNARRDIANLRTALEKRIQDLRKEAADDKKRRDDELKAAADAVAKAKEADERKKAEDALAALRKEQEEKAKAERDAKAEAERIAREDAAKQRAHDEKVAREAKEEKERADREAAEQAQRDKAEAERKAKEEKAGADTVESLQKEFDTLDIGAPTPPALKARAEKFLASLPAGDARIPQVRGMLGL